MPAALLVEEIWQVDLEEEARAVYGTTSLDHPGVRYLLEKHHSVYVSGQVKGVELPLHFDFEIVRDTPEELREHFHRLGWKNVVAFTTSEPMHRLQRQLTLDIARKEQANILIHPLLGEDQPGDMNRFARVRGYREIVRKYPHQLGRLSLLPMSRRSAGPREALLHAIVNQNYGCSHLIIGPHHASPKGFDEQFYPAGAAQVLIASFADGLAIRMLATDDHVPSREMIGFTLFFTGLSGSGKSTLARMVHSRLIEEGGRPVTLLDGDIVRLNLSSELGFSKEHRNLNIQRIGFVANEISKNGGIAICAPIAPYTQMRRNVRELIEQHGAFIEIHVSTPLEVCEARDRKGLYAKARKGIIPEFTGISDPYEEPQNPELRIDTSEGTPMEQVQQIILYLIREGYLGADNEFN